MSEFLEFFGRFKPSTWGAGGLVERDSFEVDDLESRRIPAGRAGVASTVLCATALFAFGVSQNVAAQNLAGPGFNERFVVGAVQDADQVSPQHVDNVLAFLRAAPRIDSEDDEPDPAF